MHEMEMESKIKMTLDQNWIDVVWVCHLSMNFMETRVNARMPWTRDPRTGTCLLGSIIFSISKQIYNCFFDFFFPYLICSVSLAGTRRTIAFDVLCRQNINKNHNKIRERPHEYLYITLYYLLLLFLFQSYSVGCSRSHRLTVTISNVWRCRLLAKKKERKTKKNRNSEDTAAINDNNNNSKHWIHK